MPPGQAASGTGFASRYQQMFPVLSAAEIDRVRRFGDVRKFPAGELLFQAGEAVHAGHVEIEQDEVDLAATLEELGHVLERAGFADLDMLEKAADRLPQRPAEQRMIVSNHKTIMRRIGQIRPLAARPSRLDGYFKFIALRTALIWRRRARSAVPPDIA